MAGKKKSTRTECFAYEMCFLLIVSNLQLLTDAEFREDVLQDFVGGDGAAACNGAELGDDLADFFAQKVGRKAVCLLYTSPSPRDSTSSRMPSSA